MASDTRTGTVLVGYAHQRISEGLRGLLQASFEGVFLVADRPSLIDGAGKLQPTLIIVDLALAGGDLAALLRELRQRAPRALALLLSDYEDPGVAEAALAAGADGIVHKAALATDLLLAVDAVLAGGRFVSQPAPR